jgi:hypothetical protein
VFGDFGAVLAGLISFLATFWTGRADLTIGETFRRVGGVWQR